MNKESLINLIHKDLYELKVLTNGFLEMKNFPKMLVDLAVDKTKNIADCLQKLPLNADESPAPYLEFAQHSKNQSQDIETETVEEIDVLEEQIEVAETQPEIIAEEPKIEDDVVVEILEEQTEVEELIEIAEIQPEIAAEEPNIEEEFVEEVWEDLQEEEEQIEVAETQPEIVDEEPKIEEEAEPEIKISVPKNIVQGKVAELKQAFSIADRFKFHRELFDGNGENFSKALADLNEMETLEQAQKYISKKLKFDLKNTVVQEFINILRRKLN